MLQIDSGLNIVSKPDMGPNYVLKTAGNL